MATNKTDTLLTISIKDRNKLKKLAKKEGRTMKGMITILLNTYDNQHKKS